jgi:hypothetical protein
MIGGKTDQQIIDEVKTAFDQSVERIDAETVSRLNNIRHTALDTGAGKNRHWIFYPAGAFAAAGLAIIIFNVIQHEVSTATIKTEDIEIISASDGLEFYENLEFYRWLEVYETST